MSEPRYTQGPSGTTLKDGQIMRLQDVIGDLNKTEARVKELEKQAMVKSAQIGAYETNWEPKNNSKRYREACIVPRDKQNGRPQITNEMKAECIGEFRVVVDNVCPECEESNPDIDCEICEGAFEYSYSIDVPWSTVKDIYKKMVLVAEQALKEVR